MGSHRARVRKGFPVADNRDSNLLERLADVFVYAPLGMALAVRDELPALAQRGRATTTSQVSLWRMVGELVVTTGRQQAGQTAGRWFKQATSSLLGSPSGAPGNPAGESPHAPGPQSPDPQSRVPQSGSLQSPDPRSRVPQSGRPQSPDPRSRVPQSGRPQSPDPQSRGPQSPAGTSSASGTPESHAERGKQAADEPVTRPPEGMPPNAPPSVAIPGYDTLSASQVVSLLPGLSDVERAAVRQYEAATRRRRTILSRLDQLGGPSLASSSRSNDGS